LADFKCDRNATAPERQYKSVRANRLPSAHLSQTATGFDTVPKEGATTNMAQTHHEVLQLNLTAH